MQNLGHLRRLGGDIWPAVRPMSNLAHRWGEQVPRQGGVWIWNTHNFSRSGFLFCFFLLLLCFPPDRFLGSPDWYLILTIAKADLECLILLLLTPSDLTDPCHHTWLLLMVCEEARDPSVTWGLRDHASPRTAFLNLHVHQNHECPAPTGEVLIQQVWVGPRSWLLWLVKHCHSGLTVWEMTAYELKSPLDWHTSKGWGQKNHREF